MNQVDEEFNKTILDTVNERLKTSTEDYERIRLVFLLLHTENKDANNYLRKLIAFTNMTIEEQNMFLEYAKKGRMPGSCCCNSRHVL